jgi:hypothetical protein
MNIMTRLQAGQSRTCQLNPVMAKSFSVFGFGIHLAHLHWVLGSIPPIVKQLEHEADSSLASKNKWSYMHKSPVTGHLGE